ncbi:MAG: hypothetical protein M3O46_23245 [Myxococcota bacterium]|nr:hypothetical protein [Myxococcota bacterium]
MSLDEDLRSLAPVEPASALASRVRRVAHAEIAMAHGPRWRVLARACTRIAVPAAIAVTVVGYLHWALQAAGALYR